MVWWFQSQRGALAQSVDDRLSSDNPVSFGRDRFRQDNAMPFGHISADHGWDGAKIQRRAIVKFFQCAPA